MEQNTSPAKSGIIYGVFFGLIMILEFVVGYVFGIDPQTNKSYGIFISVLNYFILPFLFIYLGCTNFKLKLNAGFISFSQCLKIGVTICVIAGLLYAVFSSVFGLIFPEYFEEIFKSTRKVMLEQNPELTEEQVTMAMSMAKKFMNPALAIPVTIAMYAFIGLIHSLIVGAIVKKDANSSF